MTSRRMATILAFDLAKDDAMKKRSLILTAAAIAGLAGATAQADEQAGANAAPKDAQRNYQLQLGPRGPVQYNDEEPFLDLTKAMRRGWTVVMRDGSTLTPAESRAEGLIDEETGLPARMPAKAAHIDGPKFLSVLGDDPNYYADHYILEWQGDAYGFVENQPRDLQKRIGANKVAFYAPPKKPFVRQLRFSMIKDGGVKSVRIYRKKYQDLVEAGEIWNPVFIDHIKGYDIIRTMDLQGTNESPVRSFADVALPTDAFYGGGLRAEWPPSPRYGVPFEILFDLADKADVKLWMNIPLMIGAPKHMADPSLRKDDRPDRIDAPKVAAMAKEHAADILKSPEWDIFAREFVDRLVASTYPQDKPLYLELGNEVWNTGRGFVLHTMYAQNIAESFNPKWGAREGYGMLSARWASALEAELARRGLRYNITYVLAGRTAWDKTTGKAIYGFKYFLAQEHKNIEDLLGRTGVALTTYTRCSRKFGKRTFGALDDKDMVKAWENAIKEDSEGLKQRLHDFCVDGPATPMTKNWLLAQWRAHAAIAEKEGVRLIGAYEGGSHDFPLDALMASDTFQRWWKDYHWGPYGADVTRQVNLALAQAFPGVILSNYVSVGPIGGAPWNDGEYNGVTDMMRMWDEFKKPAISENIKQ